MTPFATTLCCLPCAGGSAMMYARWQRLLPDRIRVLPLELPGRGGRIDESAIFNFDILIERLADDLAPRLSGPYAIFGHSMGGLLAYGLARRLQARGAALPSHLLISACGAPRGWDAGRFAGIFDDASLIDELRRRGGTPDEVFGHPELLRSTLDALAADYSICRSFRYDGAPPLPAPIRVFAGRDDDIAEPRLRAWRDETSAGFGLDWYDGGHFYIRQHEAALLDSLSRDLTRTTSEPRMVSYAAASRRGAEGRPQ